MEKENIFSTNTMRLTLLPTHGAMAMKMDDWVKLQPPFIAAGNEYEKEILLGVRNVKGEILVAASARFKYIPNEVASELEDAVRDVVKEPWFQGRLMDASVDISCGLTKHNHRFEEDIKDIGSRLSFVGEQFIRDNVREALHEEVTRETGTQKKVSLKMQPSVVTHDHTKESKGHDHWVCEHSMMRHDGTMSTVRDVYGNFDDAVKMLQNRFWDDYENYGKFVKKEELLAIRRAFNETLERKDVLRPHYEFKGSFHDKDGVKRDFHVKAEVYGERVLNKDNVLTNTKKEQYKLRFMRPKKEKNELSLGR